MIIPRSGYFSEKFRYAWLFSSCSTIIVDAVSGETEAGFTPAAAANP